MHQHLLSPAIHVAFLEIILHVKLRCMTTSTGKAILKSAWNEAQNERYEMLPRISQ